MNRLGDIINGDTAHAGNIDGIIKKESYVRHEYNKSKQTCQIK